ncbi:DUF567-domain-containing protein [Dothidotthia symphoricarpi CBS 119687]|uniref:DUF567-domain-containing protein n=1 Tax=Dothidotthia symphoricarpi CBS 119687 TaxID=1392245 RepID=A0A6A6A1Z8_9PLEO|nr:DUF567-domain-containing protein [Dothidotthia symphoricarpi CBS 119687]KAF2125869.1 DUF567-domain-containing protein [Dothidotthia symphoricarpi CBS 119687]
MALAPLPTTIGIHPPFITTRPETLILREKIFSLTGDDFEIKLLNGQPILRVSGAALSLTARKKVYDMAGNWLFDIAKELLHVHSTYKVVGSDGQGGKAEIMSVRSSLRVVGSKATARFVSANGREERLCMRGEWMGGDATVVDEVHGDRPVARIERDLSIREWAFNRSTYGVHVAPGVDMALIAALCICLDEENSESSVLGSIGG